MLKNLSFTFIHSSVFPTFIPSWNLSDLLIRVWLRDNENTELSEIENRFSGNDHDVLCALGDITLSGSPTSDSFDLDARYYNLVKELLQADQRQFS